MTKSPIQRLMYNLLPDVALPRVLKTILFIESLSGFLTVCMQQGHLVCPGCGIQAQPSQSQNQEGSYPPSSQWFTFPVKSLQSLAKMAVLLQQPPPRIQEPSLLSQAHVHSGQGPPRMVFHRQSSPKCIGEHFFLAPHAECIWIQADRSLSVLASLWGHSSLTFFWPWFGTRMWRVASSVKPCLGGKGTASPSPSLPQSPGPC